MDTLSGANLTRLYEVNDQRIMQLLPVMIYIGILCVLGTIGNSLVFYIYYTRCKRTSSSYYSLVLACLDLSSCILGMPFEVIDIRHSYIFDNPPVCKIFRFVIYTAVFGSTLTLVVIAVDRYLKVCKPLKRYNRQMRFGSIGTLILSVILATPALKVFGRCKIDTLEEYITGTECSVDGVQGTALPIVFFTILVGVFLTCVVSLVISYGRVLHKLIKRKRQTQNTIGPRPTNLTGSITVSLEMDNNVKASRQKNRSFLQDKKDPQDNVSKVRTNSESRMHVPQSQWKVPTERTTAIFICISTGFVLSFLPCLFIMIARELVPNFEDYPSLAADLCVNFFIRSFYLNNGDESVHLWLFQSWPEVWKVISFCCSCLCCLGSKSTAGKQSSSCPQANNTSYG